MSGEEQNEDQHRHHGGSVSTERLSFPLRLLIQVVTLFVMGAAFIVRIEGKLASLEEKLKDLTDRVEKRDLRADAIHSAQGADISNHNVRITVLERDADYQSGTRRQHNENR
jgi:hypothetical protein